MCIDTLISIHAPHARSDFSGVVRRAAMAKFQSTLLMRGATLHHPDNVPVFHYFNPRSSCEERPKAFI